MTKADNNNEDSSFSDDLLELGLGCINGETDVTQPSHDTPNGMADTAKLQPFDLNDILIAGSEEQQLLTKDFEMNFTSMQSTDEPETKTTVESNKQAAEFDALQKPIVTDDSVYFPEPSLDISEASPAIQDSSNDPSKNKEDPETVTPSPQSDEHSLVDFDLDALFFDSEDVLDDTSDITPTPFESFPHNPSKRSLTPPSESGDCMDPILTKKAKTLPESSGYHFPLVPSKPIETLTPESSTVPSPECPVPDSSLNALPSIPPTSLSQIKSSIQKLKSMMIPAGQLVASYTSLKQESSKNTNILNAVNSQVSEANRWRFLLADQNAKLRSDVSSSTKEKECLKSAITKLHNGTNGLKKNEKLMMEIEEKNLEIVRL